MFITKVDKFLKTGLAVCKWHGEHDEWSYKPRKSKLKNGKIGYYKCIECKMCSRKAAADYRRRNPDATDRDRFSKNGSINRILAQARARAKKSNLPFDLDREWFLEKMLIQNNRCAYSGVEFDFEAPKVRGEIRIYHPSLDQKVAGQGYTKENSEIVAAGINIMKYELPLSVFIDICKTIAKFNE